MKNLTYLFALLFLLFMDCSSKNTPYADKNKDYPVLCAKLDSAKKDTIKLQQLLTEALPVLGRNDSLIALIYHKLGVAYYTKGDDKTAIAYYQQSLAIRESIFPSIHPNIAKSHLNLARASFNLSNYLEAVSKAKKAIEISQKTSPIDTLELGDAHLTLGEIQMLLGELTSAIDNIELATKYFIDHSEDKMARCHKIWAVTLRRSKQPAQAIQQSLKALALFQKMDDSKEIADIYNNLGFAYRDLKDNKKAITALNQSLKINQQLNRGKEKGNNFIELSKAYLVTNDLNKAKEYSDSSLIIRQQQDRNELYETYTVIGDIAMAQKQADSALVFYQKALKTLDTTFKSNDSLQNPNIEIKTFNRKVELINVLVAKTGPLSILYQKTKNSAYLQAAFETYQLADKTVQVLRREMSDDQAKYFWNETALPIYRKGMDAAFQLDQLTHDMKYKLAVLQFSERTKAPVLREGIANQQAKSFAGVPAQERQRERELKTSIAILEKKAETNSAIVAQLARVRTQLYAFQDSLKTKYPSYARYLAATLADTPLSINDLKNAQNQLSDSTLLIEYAFDTTDLYTIAVTKTDFQVFKNPISSNFNTEIDRFIHSVSDLDALKKDFTRSGRDYAATSFSLYKQLLKQPLSTIHSPLPIKRIHLVLEGKLHLLPFKALTDQAVTGWNGDYPKHFLVRRYAFGSLFSLQSLTQRPPSVSEAQNDTSLLKLGCFGLDFKDSTLWRNKNVKNSTNKKNDVLANAEAEVYNIANSWHGDVYFKPAPTKSTFLKEASQYDFLHITTHGDPEGLVFQKTNPADSSYELSIGDIYSLSLHTRFTFLSACETGKGKMTEAEGVMSLGRAFTLAGSQCVVMSHWSIPDGSTSKIAQVFYTYYRNGLPKDVAEQKAEIDYLDNTHSDMHLHPNNWAALTIVGDMSPLETQSHGSPNWVWWCLGGLVLLGLFFGFRKYL